GARADVWPQVYGEGFTLSSRAQAEALLVGPSSLAYAERAVVVGLAPELGCKHGRSSFGKLPVACVRVGSSVIGSQTAVDFSWRAFTATDAAVSRSGRALASLPSAVRGWLAAACSWNDIPGQRRSAGRRSPTRRRIAYGAAETGASLGLQAIASWWRVGVGDAGVTCHGPATQDQQGLIMSSLAT